MVFALAHRDVGTAEHCRQVADLCVATAGGLMSTRECSILETAALLHDIGKLTVPDAILLKPAPLTEQELKVTHDHLRRGVAMVSSAFSSPKLTETLRHNHTWYGGNERAADSPTGEDIPLRARILAIADAFSAMVSRKPYRQARTYEDAFQELRRCSGEQFDPELVERFIEAVGARDERRAKKKPDVSDAVRLEIGLEVERLAVAVSSSDLSQLSVTASRLAAMAAKQGVRKVAELATEIEVAAAKDRDLVRIVPLATNLMDACRSLGVPRLDIANGSDSGNERELMSTHT